MQEIGLQLFSVREQTGKDFLGTIRQLSSYGYDSLQFAGFFQTPADQLKAVLDEEKLKVAGAHVGLDQLQGDLLEKTIDFNETICNKLIICPILPERMRKTGDDYRRTAEVLNQLGERIRKAGLTLGYHNHYWEFEQFSGETGFDILFENTDPDLVKMELDCYWAKYAGHEPTEIITKYHNRCVSLHLKDMKVEGSKKESTEIGKGILDLQQYVEVGKQNGVEWFVIEQEHYDRNPLDVAKENLRNLKKQFF